MEQRRERPGWFPEPADEHNEALVEAVHPEGWAAPEPAERYNLVVIGAGTAGLVAAAGVAGLGGKVALVERRLMGGDCLNTGCVPSKAVIRSARAAAERRRVEHYGLSSGGAGDLVPTAAEFQAIMRRMRRLRAEIAPHDSARRFADLGVDVFLGEGRFVSGDEVEVDGRRLRFARALIATGGRPAVPPIAGIHEVPYRTSESVFELTRRPDRLLIVGGGPIGCEMAQSFQRLGSEVTLVDRSDRLLGRDDPDAASLIARRLADEGVDLRLRSTVSSVRRRGHVVVADLETAGTANTIEASELLLAAGRFPNLEHLGLEAAGVEVRDGRLVLDGRLRTSNRRIFAAGDVAGRGQFTHLADAHARLVLRNALFLGRSRASDLVVPWCTYTDPEVAHVGMSAVEAAEAGDAIRTFTVELDDLDRAILDGETSGFARVHVDGKGRVKGATMVSAHAGESISQMSLAVTQGLTLGQLAATIHPYPTQAEAWKRLADAHERTRLTPLVAKLIGLWLRWRR